MKRYILFVWLLLSITCSAQESRKNYWAAKWVHTALITPQPVHFRFGLDKRWNKDGVTAQAGATIPWSYSVDDSIVGTKTGYAARLGWRRYYPTKRFQGWVDLFYGLDAFYNKGNNKATGEYRTKEPGGKTKEGERYEDEYSYSRTAYGMTAQIGFQYHFTSHLFLDLGFGFGGKVVTNVQQHRDNVNDSYAYPRFFEPVKDINFSTFRLAMPVLGSIGYML